MGLRFWIPSLNPGKTFSNYDSIFGSWVVRFPPCTYASVFIQASANDYGTHFAHQQALFINMANLYWWETAHRIADANRGIGATLAWVFGIFNVRRR